MPFALFDHGRLAAARWSRHASHVRRAPPVEELDELVDWLCAEMQHGSFDLVAPTSDHVAFCVAEAHERLGVEPPGQPTGEAVRDCLFKDRFATRMAATPLPTPPSATPASFDEARAAAEELGYPLLVKPRSHVAIGEARGTVVADERQLEHAFIPFLLAPGRDVALERNRSLHLPLLQRFIAHGDADVFSVVGCLEASGEVRALGHCVKRTDWPPGVGVGTRFEVVPEQAFTPDALESVRSVLGAGIFELEVIRRRSTGEVWSLDLNPRGFGQISLFTANGRDLPAEWYESVTGTALPRRRQTRRTPRYWQMGLPYYTGMAIGLVRGPDRACLARDLARAVVEPRVGSMLEWRDPGPAVALCLQTLRHPGGLVRPFLRGRTPPEATHGAPPSPSLVRRPDVAAAGGCQSAVAADVAMGGEPCGDS